MKLTMQNVFSELEAELDDMEAQNDAAKAKKEGEGGAEGGEASPAKKPPLKGSKFEETLES